MAYIYCADIYCDACGEDIKRRIIAEGKAPEHPDDTSTFDSDEFPKPCGDDEESDCPQHCGSHGDCLDPEILPDGDKVGHFFGNDLTEEGVRYVNEAIKGGGPVVELWREHYSQYYDIDQPETDDGSCEDEDEGAES